MSSVQAPFSTIEDAIEDIRQGKMVVVVDDELRGALELKNFLEKMRVKLSLKKMGCPSPEF